MGIIKISIETAAPAVETLFFVIGKQVTVNIAISDTAVLVGHIMANTMIGFQTDAVDCFRQSKNPAWERVPTTTVMNCDHIIARLNISSDIKLRDIDSMPRQQFIFRVATRLILGGKRQKSIRVDAVTIDIALEKAAEKADAKKAEKTSN